MGQSGPLNRRKNTNDHGQPYTLYNLQPKLLISRIMQKYMHKVSLGGSKPPTVRGLCGKILTNLYCKRWSCADTNLEKEDHRSSQSSPSNCGKLVNHASLIQFKQVWNPCEVNSAKRVNCKEFCSLLGWKYRLNAAFSWPWSPPAHLGISKCCFQCPWSGVLSLAHIFGLHLP